MSLGSAIRKALGNRLSRRVGHHYRAAFVDLAKVAQALSAAIPADSNVLDVGGGDGEPLNYLLELRTDIRVTTIDLAPDVGQWVDSKHAARVVRMPRTSIAQYLAVVKQYPDVLMLSDVMHHIPASQRSAFFESVSTLLRYSPGMRIIVKDVEPGFAKALFGYWADRYITGDKAVSPVARVDLISLVQSNLGPMRYEETGLFEVDKPNYVLVFYK